ncbi:MAG: TRAP transporter small permease [Alphaproteobacteria bacterium]
MAIGAAALIAAGTAFSRNVYAYTPTWTEPVMVLLVLLAVTLAVGPGLQDGVHVSIRFLVDRLSVANRRLNDKVVGGVTLLLGLMIFVSGWVYTQDLFTMGFTDYAGIPQWVQAALSGLFGCLLAIFAGAALIRPESTETPPHNDNQEA